MKSAQKPRGGTRTLLPDSKGPALETESSPWRRAKWAGVGFAVILGIGILLTNFSGDGSPDTGAGSESSHSATSSPGGSGGSVKTGGTVKGIPVGYPHSTEGAVAAAVNYEVARSSPSYFTDQPFRHAVLATIMTRESVSAQQSEDDRDASKVVASLGLDDGSAAHMIMRAAPLGTQLSSYSPEVATVKIWMSELVGITSTDSPVPVSANWSTYTLTLQWQQSDWKVADISQSAGPTPLQTSNATPDSVDTFRKMDEEFNAPSYVR